jgi:hypothetical protein
LIDRRTLVRQAVALATAGAVLRWDAANATTHASDAAVLAVVDRAVAGSESFLASARARNVRVLEFAGDVGLLWMRELEPRLRAGPVVIEAYTTAATEFCLDYLARDYGAHTVRRAESDGAVTWALSSLPARRAALAPIRSNRSASHA